MLGDVDRARGCIDSSVRCGDNLCNEYFYLQSKYKNTDNSGLKENLRSIERLFPDEYTGASSAKKSSYGTGDIVFAVGGGAIACYGAYLIIKAGQP